MSRDSVQNGFEGRWTFREVHLILSVELRIVTLKKVNEANSVPVSPFVIEKLNSNHLFIFLSPTMLCDS